MNPLTTSLLATIRIARDRAELIAQLREMLSVAIEMLAKRDKQLDNARRGNQALRDELRRGQSKGGSTSEPPKDDRRERAA